MTPRISLAREIYGSIVGSRLESRDSQLLLTGHSTQRPWPVSQLDITPHKRPCRRQGKVQEEELDSCRVEPASEGRQRDEGAGRNPSGFSLPLFGARERGGRFAAPSSDAVRQLCAPSLRVWLPSWL